MSHTEKQRIFDQYANSKGYESFFEIIHDYAYLGKPNEILNHCFAACDLVQQEQQKRIASSLKNVEVAESAMHEYADEIGMMDEEEYIKARKTVIKKNKEFFKSIKSITNPENLIR